MDLLNETPCRFRYGLYHTSDSKIIIVYIETNEEITTESQTLIESLYENTIFLNYKINKAETLKVTCSQNQITMKQFDSNIIEYCKRFKDTVEIRLINGTPTHQLLFGVDVFKEMVNNTKELYIEIGDSGLHIGTSDFKTLDKLSIQSGKLYPKDTVNIYVKNLFIMSSDITVANKDNDKHAFNFIVSKIANIINLKLYSTITTVITAGSKDGDDISNSKLISNYIEIYGEEKVEDNNKERIGLFGFKSVLLGELHVDEEVVVGNILKVDKIVSFTINKFYRKIKSMSNGYGVCIYRVGNVNLTNIGYELDDDSDIPDNVSIIHFLKDTDSGLHKKIFLYDSSITNPTDKQLTLVSLEETSVENVYVSNCTIGNGITLIDKHKDAQLIKMTFNKIIIDVVDDITFDNVEKLYLTDCTLTTKSNLNISGKFISINGGEFEFSNCFIGKSNEIVYNINTSGIEIHGSSLSILNDRENSLDGKYFDNNSKFDVESILIDGYQSSLANAVLFSKSITCKSDKILTLTRSTIVIKDGEVNLTSECSISGILMIECTNSDDKLKLTVSDKERFLQNNTLDFIITSGESPIIEVNTNTSVKLKNINNINELFYISYLKDFQSDQPSRVTFIKPIDTNISYKVMTNSEKMVSITEKKENNDVVFEVNKK